MRAPQLVRGLIIQNANAHETGMARSGMRRKNSGPSPTPRTKRPPPSTSPWKARATTYLSGVPADIAARIDPQNWEEDWRVMCLPGRMKTQRDLLADYGRYAAQFEEIAAYLKAHQPPALMVWGRHEVYFDIAEIPSWLEDLPRMEAHILDGGHLLLETHAARAAELIQKFLEDAPAV
jgi:pimeloyl-ACP methyl ester carboxylesterase